MKSWQTVSGLTVTRVLGGRCNCFAIGNGNDFALVDTGRITAWKRLRKNLEALGVRRGNLAALVLTHAHFDHAENAARVKAEYGTMLISHAAEGGFLAEGDCPLPGGSIFPTRVVMGLFGERLRARFRYDPVAPDVTVDERLDLGYLGFDAYLLHTPGHSAGSMSVIAGSEIALAGDTLFGVIPGSVFTPFADDIPLMVRSWKKLIETGCRLYLPAHGGPVTRELLSRQCGKHARRDTGTP